MRLVLLLLLVILNGETFAQQLVFPDQPEWTHLDEGKPLSFTLTVNGNLPPVRYALDGGNGFGMQLDSVGHFNWTPSFDLVPRLEKQKEVSVIFQVEWKDGKHVRQPVNFLVNHINRPPVAEELPTFYVKQNTPSKYQIPFCSSSQRASFGSFNAAFPIHPYNDLLILCIQHQYETCKKPKTIC